MENSGGDKRLCRNVFKGGVDTTSKEQFTKKWIELINTIEKSRAAEPVRRQQ